MIFLLIFGKMKFFKCLLVLDGVLVVVGVWVFLFCVGVLLLIFIVNNGVWIFVILFLV